MNNRNKNENSMHDDVVRYFGLDAENQDLKSNLRKAKRETVTAVYFLWKDGEVAYVGATTTHPIERMHTHIKTEQFDDLSWIEVPGFLLSAVEWFYIDKLRPAFNRNKYKPWLGADVAEAMGVSVEKLNTGEDKNAAT